MPATDGRSTNNDFVALTDLRDLMTAIGVRFVARRAGDRERAREADALIDQIYRRMLARQDGNHVGNDRARDRAGR